MKKRRPIYDDVEEKNRHCCLTIEDCESTVTMRIRCRRVHLIAVMMVLLMLFSLTTNATLMRKFNQQMRKSGAIRHLAIMNEPSPNQPRKRFGQRARSSQNPPKVTPRAESLLPNATFAACLLIKDDNEILNEWIAYHYFVLNLRSIIVAVDPLSSESPSRILNKWRIMTDLDVQEWTDNNYMPKEFLLKHQPPKKYMQKPDDFKYNMSHAALIEISNHRYRQRVFLAQCMKTLRKQGSSWMAHIDTDEFIVASKLLRQMKPDYLEIPPMDEPGSVMNLIQQVTARTPTLVSYPCLSLLRVLFGSVESSPTDRDRDVPAGFDANRFETLRWRYHALPHNMSAHGNPKVILDVAAIPEEYFPKDVVYSIHRPVTAYCKRNKEVAFANFRKQPLGANHYLGSWERYSRRADKRRSRAVYDEKADQRRGKDDGVRPWLKGFVRVMGAKVATKLLGEEYLQSEFRDDYKYLSSIYRATNTRNVSISLSSQWQQGNTSQLALPTSNMTSAG